MVFVNAEICNRFYQLPDWVTRALTSHYYRKSYSKSMKIQKILTSKKCSHFFLRLRKVSNPFPMHQVIPGADVFHSFVTKLRYVPQAKCSGPNRRGLLGLDGPVKQI